MDELPTSPSLIDLLSEDESVNGVVLSSDEDQDDEMNDATFSVEDEDQVMDDATSTVDGDEVENEEYGEYEDEDDEGIAELANEDEAEFDEAGAVWDEYEEEEHAKDEDEGSEYRETDSEDNGDAEEDEEDEEVNLVHPGYKTMIERGFAYKPPPGPPYIAEKYAAPPSFLRPRSSLSSTLPPEPDMQIIIANSTTLNRSVARWQGSRPLTFDDPECYRILWNYVCRNDNCPLFQYEWFDVFDFCKHLEIKEHGADGRHVNRRERVAMASREQVLVAPGRATPGVYVSFLYSADFQH